MHFCIMIFTKQSGGVYLCIMIFIKQCGGVFCSLFNFIFTTWYFISYFMLRYPFDSHFHNSYDGDDDSEEEVVEGG